MRVPLNRERIILEKGEALDLPRIRQVDEDADALPGFGFEHSLKQSRQTELRKNARI